MKIKLLILGILSLTSCTDAHRASFSALGKEGNIKCYSGGILVYEGIATGKIVTLHQSDGWEFEEVALSTQSYTETINKQCTRL